MKGTILGTYRIQSELGSGGMGTVWLAEDGEGRPCAIKVIHPHLLETPGFFKRFLREAEIGRKVLHENVVRCFDCDALLVDGRQVNFLVMEYVEGQTLRELLEELSQVPEELCRHIGREVAKGLAAIHGVGVVHRDVKPENVLITAEHVVKLMDLGVARLADEVRRLSVAGAFVGSLEYAAPEQLKGGGEALDARADLHALGLTLYELVTGQHPFRADDVSRVISSVLTETPRKAGEVNPQLSPFFEEVLARLLEKDPGKRFSSAADLLTVLEQGERSAWWKERAKGIRIETKRPLRRVRIPRETALYGRDGEIERLRALFGAAKAGDGRAVLIEGEAGIGKSRLVDEFVGRLREEGEDLNFLFGSYPPGGAATASGAWSTAYREHFGTEGLVETLEGYLATTKVLIPAFSALLKGEPAPEGTEPLTKDSIQTVFVHATCSLAAERSTIVLIEDLHFAPEEGRAMFASLALAVPGQRILLLGTMRPGVPEAWTANVTRLEHAEHRTLTRLGPKDLALLLRDAFHSEALAEELGTKIALKCDGNPFFAFEIIRGLRDGQFITRQPDGTWVTTRAIREIEVPSSVLDLVNARVADLSEEERDLLDVASCCGFEFDPLLVADASGVAQLKVLKRLAQIERRHRLVRSAGTNHVFDHHQVQEALYGSLSEPLRMAYHSAIGDAMEAHGSKDAVAICEHHLKGGQGAKALPHLDPALTHLEQGFVNDRAIALAERALGVPGLLAGTERCEILSRLAEPLDLLGRRAQELEALEEAAALADGAGNDALRARTRVALGRLFVVTARYAEADAVLRTALDLARAAGDRTTEGRAAGSLGLVFVNQGRYEEARAQFEEHLALARETGHRRGEATATGNLGLVFLHQGRYEEARAHFEAQIALAPEIGDRAGEVIASGNLGVVFLYQGRQAEARAQFEASSSLAREIGDRAGEARARGNLGVLLLDQGRYEDARAHFAEHIVLARGIGHRADEADASGNLGVVCMLQGRYEEAGAQIEGYLALTRELGDRQGEAYALASLGDLADAGGDAETAQRRYEDALALRRELGEKANVAMTLAALGELDLRAGDTERAAARLDEALALAREVASPGVIVTASAHRARLPGGESSRALAALQEHENECPLLIRLNARFTLWQVTGDRAHLEEAKRLLDFAVEHTAEEHRPAMLAEVRLHREVMEAWAARHGN